jgi:predicted HD superfamily hydrolase involved in NAD metabolism
MDTLCKALTEGTALSGDLPSDVVALLARHGHAVTATHCARVAAEAGRLAQQFGAEVARAETAGWLHDVSAIIPTDRRLWYAQQWGIDVLPEEASAPMILHQKLSAFLAADVFGVSEPEILSAIGCHTTLKADASGLDKVVFLADKAKWDGISLPPYQDALLAAVEASLDEACWCYLDYLWQRRSSLRVIHPWFAAAYRQLSDHLQRRTAL